MSPLRHKLTVRSASLRLRNLLAVAAYIARDRSTTPEGKPASVTYLYTREEDNRAA